MSTEYPFARKIKNPCLSLKTLCVLAFSLLLVSHMAWAEEALRAVRVAAVAYPQGKGAVLSGEAALIERDPVLKADLQKLGVELQWTLVPTQGVAATINEAFANGSIDFASYGDLPSVILNAGGVDTVIVGPGGNGLNVYLIVPLHSTVKSIRDLKGKRIALHRGRPWELSFARLLAANGLKLSDFKIKNLNPQSGAAALASGDVDALVTLSDIFTLVDKGIGRILWSTKEPGQNWKIRTELWGRKSFVNSHPGVTQALVNAHVRAAHWISREENFEEFLTLAARSGQSETFVRKEYETDIVPWRARFNPLYDGVLEHYRNVVAYSKSSGLIRREFDADRLLEPRFIEHALRELNLQEYWRNGNGKARTPAQARK
ncbi:MAG: ABC transporter substrate-binding protein [Zoogloeaceae bacterium]|nr:ABC transporter substrate-binding protein [Zoogloeaceae bacterium]